jgi:hypothetical protein
MAPLLQRHKKYEKVQNTNRGRLRGQNRGQNKEVEKRNDEVNKWNV